MRWGVYMSWWGVWIYAFCGGVYICSSLGCIYVVGGYICHGGMYMSLVGCIYVWWVYMSWCGMPMGCIYVSGGHMSRCGVCMSRCGVYICRGWGVYAVVQGCGAWWGIYVSATLSVCPTSPSAPHPHVSVLFLYASIPALQIGSSGP